MKKPVKIKAKIETPKSERLSKEELEEYRIDRFKHQWRFLNRLVGKLRTAEGLARKRKDYSLELNWQDLMAVGYALQLTKEHKYYEHVKPVQKAKKP